jgi:protocatechuate 3,4-dioxygenase beta subunit
MTMTIWHRLAHSMTRRQFMGTSAVAAAGAIAAVACSDDDEPEAAAPTATREASQPTSAASPTEPVQTLAPTPACADDDDATVAQTEGPYFTPNSPERASLLEDGLPGTTLVLTGSVLSTQCAPVARALVDFWHCDDAGAYDNEGYRLRGHQFTSDDGAYRLETIVPGLYTGRTRHIHVKVQAPDRDVLTTQLYFPGEADNASDGIFDESLVMAISDVADGKAARFDFVLELG